MIYQTRSYANANVGYYGDICGQQAVVAASGVTCAPDISNSTEYPSVTVKHTADNATSTNLEFTTAPSSSVESTCPVCPNTTMENTTTCPICPELNTAAPCPEITTAAPEMVTSCPTPEPEMDYCSDNPCQNSGTCYNGTNGFFCKCAGLWGGLNCTQGNKSSLNYILIFSLLKS